MIRLWLLIGLWGNPAFADTPKAGESENAPRSDVPYGPEKPHEKTTSPVESSSSPQQEIQSTSIPENVYVLTGVVFATVTQIMIFGVLSYLFYRRLEALKKDQKKYQDHVKKLQELSKQFTIEPNSKIYKIEKDIKSVQDTLDKHDAHLSIMKHDIEKLSTKESALSSLMYRPDPDASEPLSRINKLEVRPKHLERLERPKPPVVDRHEDTWEPQPIPPSQPEMDVPSELVNKAFSKLTYSELQPLIPGGWLLHPATHEDEKHWRIAQSAERPPAWLLTDHKQQRWWLLPAQWKNTRFRALFDAANQSGPVPPGASIQRIHRPPKGSLIGDRFQVQEKGLYDVTIP